MTLPLLPGRNQLAAPFMAVVGDPITRETVRGVAGRFGWGEATVREGGAGEARELLAASPAPAVLVVDVSDCDDVVAAMDALADVCDPHTRVVALGRANDVELYRALMRMGVSDYLVKPVAAEALADALHRAAHPQAAEPAATRPARVVALIGVRGGVGATSLALSVAWDLAHEQQKKTVLLDLDMQFGAAALALDLEPGRGLREILTNPERIDALLIGSAMTRQSDRLHVLGAEEPLEDDIDIGPRGLSALLGALSETAELVVVDTPRRADRLTRETLARADAVAVVTDLSLPAMRDTQRVLSMLRSLRPQGGVTVVANRAGGVAGEVPQGEFEKAIAAKIDLLVPYDAKAATTSAERAKPMAAVAAAGPLQDALRGLTAALGGDAPPAQPEPEKGSWLQRILGR